jgi:hypothetical protein
MSQFSLDIANFIKKAEGDIRDVKVATIFELSSQIIKKTPVDTGRAKGNWQYSFGAPKTGVVSSNNTAPLGALGSVNFGISDQFGVDYIVNNLDYIEYLEDGRSNQAPIGMVKTTVAQFRQIVERKARGI